MHPRISPGFLHSRNHLDVQETVWLASAPSLQRSSMVCLPLVSFALILRQVAFRVNGISIISLLLFLLFFLPTIDPCTFRTVSAVGGSFRSCLHKSTEAPFPLLFFSSLFLAFAREKIITGDRRLAYCTSDLKHPPTAESVRKILNPTHGRDCARSWLSHLSLQPLKL